MKFIHQYIIASSIVSVLSFLVYAKHHNRITFDFFELLSLQPIVWGMTLILGVGFALFLNIYNNQWEYKQ